MAASEYLKNNFTMFNASKCYVQHSHLLFLYILHFQISLGCKFVTF